MSPTSQQSLDEHPALGLELPVKVEQDCFHDSQHNLEVGLQQGWLAGGVQQVLQLRDQQLAHPHQQGMLKGRYAPAAHSRNNIALPTQQGIMPAPTQAIAFLQHFSMILSR